jgi:protein phosphatase
MVLKAAALSETGRVRDHNEDAFVLLPESGILAVSDGMGGHQAGETAARAVAGALPILLEHHLGSVPIDEESAALRALRDAIVELSRELFRQSAGRPGLAGMGATVVVACVRDAKLLLAHMGDSRAYLLRAGELAGLTADHSLVGLLLREGEITEDEVAHHPLRGRLSRYVGMEGVVYPDVRALPLAPRDRLLLCTDGLTSTVGDEGIASVLRASASPEAACRALVDAALARGAPDNVTALVADWGA